MDGRFEERSPLDVWMDGECGLCRSSRAWCERRAPESTFRFIDFRTEESLPKSRDAHQSSMWVRDPGGAMLEGFDAWRRIMAELPRWRVVARVAGLAPFTLLGRYLYRLVAAHRHRLG